MAINSLRATPLSSELATASNTLHPGTVTGKTEPMDHDLVDAKVAASEARADAKFAELRGDMRIGFGELAAKMDQIALRLEHSASEITAVKTGMSELKAEVRAAEDRNRSESMTTRSTVVVTAIGSFLALGGLMVGLLAYGGDQFGRGADIGSRIRSEVQEQVRSTAPTPTPPPPDRVTK